MFVYKHIYIQHIIYNQNSSLFCNTNKKNINVFFVFTYFVNLKKYKTCFKLLFKYIDI